MTTARDRNSIVALLAIPALIWVAVATVRTTTARVSATTENSANTWSAGQIDVTTDSVRRVLLDADNLSPVDQLSSCLQIDYAGSVAEIDLRLYASVDGGTGLERYVDVVLEVGTGATAEDCTQFVPSGAPLFEGTLDQLVGAHGSYAEGLMVIAGAMPGDRVSLRLGARVSNDNDAQGLSTLFYTMIEGQP